MNALAQKTLKIIDTVETPAQYSVAKTYARLAIALIRQEKGFPEYVESRRDINMALAEKAKDLRR